MNGSDQAICLCGAIDINSMEVVELLFVPVRQVPVDAEVFRAQVVPFVGIGIVGNCVVVDVLACHEAAGDLDELAGVDLGGSADFLAILSWNPASSHDQGGSVDADGVFLHAQCALHRDLTALIAVEGVDYVEARHLFSIDCLVAWDQYLFRVVELSEDEVGSEPMVHSPFFLGHAPPTEVHLLPGCAICHSLLELIVSL